MIFEKGNNTEKKIEPLMSSSHVLLFLLESAAVLAKKNDWLPVQLLFHF